MLNISDNSVKGRIDTSAYKAFEEVKEPKYVINLSRILLGFFGLLLLLSFLPWTQNIRARGYVTTLKPDQRPQSIHSVIAGRVENWYMQEGDFVRKGDTLLNISEVKDDYFDPELLARTEDQLEAKNLSLSSYKSKVKALEQQISALKEMRGLKQKQNENKLKQAQLKIISDSIDLEAAKINLQITGNQFARYDTLYKRGLKSLTDYETRKLKWQEALARRIALENKLLTSKNELINAQLELFNINNEYQDKISKAESELFTALSSQYTTEAEMAKLRNQLSNYNIRSGMYFIKAPQDGYITQANTTGIGEMIKEGTEIVSIMPSNYQLAAEIFIKPLDLPLIKQGHKLRLIFDGWPFIVFSGWPSLSVGTYGGVVVAVDNFANKNGKYRVLVAQDPDDDPWPKEIRVGSGTTGFALLQEVPIWYEIWRNLNGFPPDFYENNSNQNQSEK